jgi:hypothetical protein
MLVFNNNARFAPYTEVKLDYVSYLVVLVLNDINSFDLMLVDRLIA